MLGNAYIRDKGNELEPIYVPGEAYSFYMNFDEPITDENFSSFRLHLLQGTSIVAPNIGVLKKYMVSTYAYNIYCEYTFPNVPDGCYNLIIEDTSISTIKAKSNCICVDAVNYKDNSVMLKYRHKRPIAGIIFDAIPAFYIKVRLPLNKVDFQYDVDRKQYRNVSDGKLRNLHSRIDKFVKIESYYFDEAAHDAMAVVYECSEIIIRGMRYVVKDAYQVDTDQLSALTKGSVNAYEQERVFDLTIYD